MTQAKRKPLLFLFPEFDDQLLLQPLPEMHSVAIEQIHSCGSVGDYLETDHLVNEGEDIEVYSVEDSLIDRWSDVFGKFLALFMFIRE
jgi:hypothetical protein